MGTISIVFTDSEGVQRVVDDAEVDRSVMEVARANAVAGILADCGGACSCATCHVYVAAEWFDRVGPPDEVEEALLDMVDDVRRPTSRLSCQIAVRPELNGLRVDVAPEL